MGGSFNSVLRSLILYYGFFINQDRPKQTKSKTYNSLALRRFRNMIASTESVATTNMCFTMAKTVFCISMKMMSVKKSFFGEGEHIDNCDKLPIWLFPKRGHDREMAQTEKTVFKREHQFYMGMEHFQLYHMLRPQNLRRMVARDHCAKSKIEQRRGSRILKRIGANQNKGIQKCV